MPAASSPSADEPEQGPRLARAARVRKRIPGWIQDHAEGMEVPAGFSAYLPGARASSAGFSAYLPGARASSAGFSAYPPAGTGLIGRESWCHSSSAQLAGG